MRSIILTMTRLRIQQRCLRSGFRIGRLVRVSRRITRFRRFFRRVDDGLVGREGEGKKGGRIDSIKRYLLLKGGVEKGDLKLDLVASMDGVLEYSFSGGRQLESRKKSLSRFKKILLISGAWTRTRCDVFVVTRPYPGSTANSTRGDQRPAVLCPYILILYTAGDQHEQRKRETQEEKQN